MAPSVNAVQLDGPWSSLQGMVAQAVSAPTAGALERIYDEVTPESFGALQAATLTSALGFSQQMNTCRSITDASYISSTRDRCNWGTIGNTSTTQLESGDVLGYNESATGVTCGTESAIGGDKRTFFGAGFNFSYDNLNVNSTTMNGSRYMGGLSLKREADNGFVYTAELTGGVASYQTNRWIVFPSQTMSDADGASGYGTISTPDVQATSTGHVSFLRAGIGERRSNCNCTADGRSRHTFRSTTRSCI